MLGFRELACLCFCFSKAMTLMWVWTQTSAWQICIAGKFLLTLHAAQPVQQVATGTCNYTYKPVSVLLFLFLSVSDKMHSFTQNYQTDMVTIKVITNVKN